MTTHIIDTPEAIAAFRFATIIRALKFEVNTGMKMSRTSTLKVAQRDYGVTSKTKKDAIVELEAMLDGVAS